MIFKGIELETGDYIAFTAKDVPLPEVHAVVIDVKDGTLEVASTMLAFFHHSGLFAQEDVREIIVVHSAEVAIPQESRGRGFRKHQQVSTVIDGTTQHGEVIAAFDGIVITRRADGRLITGGAMHFTATDV